MGRDVSREIILETVAQVASVEDAQTLVKGLLWFPMSTYDTRTQLLYAQLLLLTASG